MRGSEASTPNSPSIPATDMEPNSCNAPLGTEKAKRLDSPGGYRVHIHSRRYRLTDADGASAKAVIDGLVHAGIFADDKAEIIREVSFSQEKIHKTESEETIIEIFEMYNG